MYTVPSPANANNWLVSGFTAKETRQGSFITCTKWILWISTRLELRPYNIISEYHIREIFTG